MDFRETLASSVFPGALIILRSAKLQPEDPTFDFGLKELQELLVNPNEALLPLTKPRDGLTNFYRLFLFRERSNSIPGDDVLEDSHLG